MSRRSSTVSPSRKSSAVLKGSESQRSSAAPSPRTISNSRRTSSSKALSRQGSRTSILSAASRSRGLLRRRSSVTFKEESAELEFLGTVNSLSSKQDITKMLLILTEATKKAHDPHLIAAACQAVGQVCETRKGFLKMLKAQGIDTLIQAAHLPQRSGGEAAMRASKPVCQAASDWMDAVDEVEFTELPDLMNITKQLGVFDEGVAESALGAMGRFGLHRREHAAAMLEAGALTVLHQIIGAHRNPELLQDAHVLLYRLCDLPAENVLPVLSEELDLVKTVSEGLTQAPLNMRLQLSGLRLFTLWSKFGDRKVLNAIARASAQASLQRVEGDLQRSGFTHAADWLSAVAGRALAGAMPTQPGD